MFGGAQYVHHRWLMEPWGCFVAEENEGKIVGVSVAVCWGTLGLFGPVAVLTPYQNQKIAQQLVRAAQGFFDENRVTLQGVVTYPVQPEAPRPLPEVRLQAAGAGRDHRAVARAARAGAAREARPRGAGDPALLDLRGRGRRRGSSGASGPHRNAIYRGLDLTKEIEIVDGLALGDTLLLEKDGAVLGFAICHTPGVSEAPQGALYVKYLAIDPRKARRPEHFVQLLAPARTSGSTRRASASSRRSTRGYWTAYQTLLASGLPRGHADAPHEARQERRLRARGGLRPRRLALTVSRAPATSGRKAPGGARRRRT